MRFRKMLKLQQFPGVMERSGRRVAAARRAVRKDLERNALTPELVKHHNAEDRLDAREQWLIDRDRRDRARRAESWRRARTELRDLPTDTQTAVRDYWQRGVYPADPVYLLGLIRNVKTGALDLEAEEREMRRLRELGRKWRGGK